jgi:hypothetical protein
VKLDDHDWLGRLVSAPHPLDQAGVRDEAQDALASILEAYATEPEDVRKTIRVLLADYSAFIWAVYPKDSVTTADGFRQYLLMLSAVDQSKDIRDTMLSVHALCAEARSAGVNIEPILLEVAAISSNEGIGNMGSLRSVLRAAC